MAIKVSDFEEIVLLLAPKLVISESGYLSDDPTVHIVRKRGVGLVGGKNLRSDITDCGRVLRYAYIRKSYPSRPHFNGCKRCAKTIETFQVVHTQWFENDQAARKAMEIERKLKNAEFDANRNWTILYKQIEKLIEEAAMEAVELGVTAQYPDDDYKSHSRLFPRQ